MSSERDNPIAVDQGLIVLTSLLRFHGIGVDPEQVRHSFGEVPIGVIRNASSRKADRAQGPRYKDHFRAARKMPLPGIAVLRDGGFLLLGKAGDGKVLVQSPLSPRPQLMTQAEFEAVWDGRMF